MGLWPQTRLEKCLRGSDPLLPARQPGVCSSEPVVPSSGGAPQVAKSGQGEDGSQLGSVNLTVVRKETLKSKREMWPDPHMTYTCQENSKDTYPHGWNSFPSDHCNTTLLLTLSSRKRQKMTFYFLVDRLQSALSEARELTLHYFFLFQSNLFQIFCLPSCTFHLRLLGQLIGPRTECLHYNTGNCKLLSIY